MQSDSIEFFYTNHAGKTAFRSVQRSGAELLYDPAPNPAWGYQPGWFLRGMCNDREELRSFALVNIITTNEDQPNGFHELQNLEKDGKLILAVF